MPNVEIIGFAPSTYTRAARMVCEEKSNSLRFEARAAACA